VAQSSAPALRHHTKTHTLATHAVQEFMEAYLAACEAYENELERLRGEGVVEHAALKRRWAGELPWGARLSNR